MDDVEAILRRPSSGDDEDGYVFAMDRHADLVKTLGISELAIGLGFDYVGRGELPPGLTKGDLIPVTASLRAFSALVQSDSGPVIST